jgi:hypothetical protein
LYNQAGLKSLFTFTSILSQVIISLRDKRQKAVCSGVRQDEMKGRKEKQVRQQETQEARLMDVTALPNTTAADSVISFPLAFYLVSTQACQPVRLKPYSQGCTSDVETERSGTVYK